MQHDRESGQLFFDAFEHIESQWWRHEAAFGIACALCRCEFVGAMRCTNRDGEAVATGFGGKINHFFGARVGVVVGHNFVFDTGQNAEFAFDGYIELMCIFNHFFGQCHVFVVRQVRAVNHHRRETHVDARFAQFETVAMVEMQHDFGFFPTKFFGISHGTFGHVAQQGLIGVVACAFRHLQNDRRFSFGGSHDDGLQLFHVVEVECRNSIATFDGFGKHFACVYQS